MEKQWLNYHHLYYFRTIAQEGGIAKAAKRLRLGQPTLSTQLRQFEDAIGHKLFERKQKRLYLTESGRAALEYANEIFRLGDEMVEVLHDRRITDRVELQIGALDTVPKSLTMRLIERARSVQNCTVSIAEGRADELIRELRAHRLDIVISDVPPPAGEGGLFAKKIATMPVVVCGARQFAPLKRNFPASLAGAPFVLPTWHCRLRQDLEHLFKVQNLRPDVVVEVQDTALQKLLAVHGVGITVVAAQAVQELIDNRDLVMIGELPDVYEELWLIVGDRRIANPVAAKLMQEFTV